MKARVGGLVVLVLVLVPVSPGGAEPSPDERRGQVDEELERLREERDEAAAKEVGVLAELEATRRVRSGLGATVAELDASIATAQAELAGTEAGLEAAVSRHLEAERQLRTARVDLAESDQVLREQAISSFMRYGGEDATLDVVLRVRDIRHLHEAAAFLDAVARAQAEVVERHRRLEETTTELEAEAERARIEAAGHRDAVAARKQSLEAVRAEQAAALADVEGEEGREEDLLATVQETRAAHERHIVELEAESRTIAALLRHRQAAQPVTTSDGGVGHAAARSPGGALGYPLASAVITSRYGFRTHPIFGTRRLHAGLDFRGATGTPVLAAGDGTVVFSGPRGGYGNTVVIDHGGSLATLYAHQTRLAVGTGTPVRRGQAVGAVGSTGFSTGPHLHFEVRVNGTPVDPLNHL